MVTRKSTEDSINRKYTREDYKSKKLKGEAGAITIETGPGVKGRGKDPKTMIWEKKGGL